MGERAYEECLLPFYSMCNNTRRDDIKFCSWNVNDVNKPVKRGKVLARLKFSDVVH